MKRNRKEDQMIIGQPKIVRSIIRKKSRDLNLKLRYAGINCVHLFNISIKKKIKCEP